MTLSWERFATKTDQRSRMNNWIRNPDREILVNLTGTTYSDANLPIRSGIGFLVRNLKDDWALNKSSSMVKNESGKLKVLHDACWAKDIPSYSGPKAARETHADLKQLSAIPGHIYMRPELQILPGQRRFSKMPWLVPMLELLPPTSIGHLKEWGLSTVFVLAKNYNKLVHVWESVTAMVELWHPQTNSFIFPEFEATILLEELEIMLGLPRYQRGEELAISYTVEQINSWSILAYITTKKTISTP
ncbi:hypothetical protein Taro_022593 [Colocasia esculenta]|uniref:Aminotransferase-like plant mobile domain-containing protein n=1 Tax=Colocasia esculenta TaxID=4460 RepID=A0A843V2A7_COLES|nr:hypothetical protein [Colocasia esculenta]